jgi:hypothetical protein
MDSCENVGWYLEWVCRYPGLGPFAGAIIATLIAAGFGFFIGHLYSRRLKETEVIHDLSRRFQSLLEIQHRLNVNFFCDPSGQLRPELPKPSPRDENDAWNLFRNFFELVHNEFNYFQDGVLREDTFVEWMLWRWYDWDPSRNPLAKAPRPGGLNITGLDTCGITYHRAWTWWTDRPVIGKTRFARFINELHVAPTEAAARAVIHEWRPRRWSRHP